MAAATRLRRTFHYPSESDSDESHLDEEHQEELISTLQFEDANKNNFYRRAFLLLPALSALVFLYNLVLAGTARDRLMATLSLTSLTCTAYIIHFLPVESPEGKGKRAVYRVDLEKGPVERFMVPLNAAIAGLLLLAAIMSWRMGLSEEASRRAVPGGTSRSFRCIHVLLGLTN